MLYPDPQPVPEEAPVVLAARGLSRGLVQGVDLQVRAGEILGIAGLVGSGRTETLRLLFGADRGDGVVVASPARPGHRYTSASGTAAGAIHADSGMPSQNGGQLPGPAEAGAQTEPLKAPQTTNADARILRT